MYSAVPEQHHITDQVAGLGDLDAQGQCLTRVGEFGGGPMRGEPFVDHLPVHRLERHVTADIRAAPVGQQRANIGGGQQTEQQSAGPYRKHGTQLGLPIH
jgi:hypothetical protein